MATAPPDAQWTRAAAYDGWTYHGLGGPTLRGLQLHGGYLYAASDSGLFVKPAADADTTAWTPLGFEGQPVWSFDVLSPNEIIAAVIEDVGTESPRQQLYRTGNGGATWERIANHLLEDAPEERFGFIRHVPGDPTILFAGGFGVLARSDDGGVSWRPVLGAWDSFGMGVHFIAFDPLRPDIMWSGGESTIFWPFLLKSTDAGESWEHRGIDLGGDNAVYSMAIDSTDPDILYIGAEGSVLKSTDGGDTWDTILAPDTYEYFFGLVISPADADRIYAAGMRNALDQRLTLYVSDDGGASWSTITHGEESLWLGVEHVALQGGSGADTLYLGTRYDGVQAYTASVPTGSEGRVPVPPHHLGQNVPNPVAHSTNIPFTLSAPAHVQIIVYDTMGREVVRLIDGLLPAGSHEVGWTPAPMPSGVYLYRLQAGEVSVVRRMVVVKE